MLVTESILGVTAKDIVVAKRGHVDERNVPEVEFVFILKSNDVIFLDAPVFLIDGVDVEKIKCAA